MTKSVGKKFPGGPTEKTEK